MSIPQRKSQRQTRKARLAIESELYLRGYSIRQIAEEIRKRLGLEKAPSTSVVHNDLQKLLQEWREERIENMDYALHLELQRIDFACKDLWEQWEKSKTEVKSLGDPRYISEIRQQLQERRKLLGLYAPEKREITGEMSFASLLMESGQVEEAE